MFRNADFRYQNSQIIGKIRGRGNSVAMETMGNHSNRDSDIPEH